ncbi:hypothetical protein L1049_006052 [Liquidambar formosana]|uniref:Cytochrome P450 n=1 Tax=Liquidambar formosana TaxID=63359 RepID=A0AAP0WT39_LIQFO
MYAVGRMASVWGKDCLEFKPERWISEEGGIKHEPSHKFFAFSAGPRTCPGKELGLIRMKAIAATIIHNYHVQAYLSLSSQQHPVKSLAAFEEVVLVCCIPLCFFVCWLATGFSSGASVG